MPIFCIRFSCIHFSTHEGLDLRSYSFMCIIHEFAEGKPLSYTRVLTVLIDAVRDT